jgi:hypothetical protein
MVVCHLQTRLGGSLEVVSSTDDEDAGEGDEEKDQPRKPTKRAREEVCSMLLSSGDDYVSRLMRGLLYLVRRDLGTRSGPRLSSGAMRE